MNVQANDNFFKLGHWNESDGTLSSVDVSPDGSVKLNTATGDIPLGTWTTDHWFNVDVEFDLAQSRVRGRRDGGPKSEYGAFVDGRTAVLVQTYVLGRGAEVWLDDWSIPRLLVYAQGSCMVVR